MSTDQIKKLSKRQQFWFDHIKNCETSGQSLAGYAKENDLNVQTMYATKATLVSKGMLSQPIRPTFQRAKINATTIQHDWRIQLPNGINVIFSGAANINQLSSILQIVTKV